MPQWEISFGDFSVRSSLMNERCISLEATRDSAPVWRLSLDVTGGDRNLMPRMQKPIVAGDYLLVQTDGEHSRGASSHEPRVHGIDANGTLLWWKPWRLIGAPVDSRYGLLMLCQEQIYHFSAGEPLAVARLLDRKKGRVMQEWEFHLPDEMDEDLSRASWPIVNGKVYEKGSRLKGEIYLQWRDGDYSIKKELNLK